MSATPPPADLRARILAAASADPAPPRAQGTRATATAILAGFVVPVAVSFYLGWPSAANRPASYVGCLAAAWLAVGLFATWGGVARGQSMLGRPTALRLGVVLLTPALLLTTAMVGALAWPGTLADDATMGNHLVCDAFALLCALGPLVAFAVVRRGSDPVAPRLTGAAIGAASGAWGALAIHLHCAHTSPTHVVFGHILPVAVLALVGVVIGDRVVAVRARSEAR
ncbi:MAG: NrsF family protein [Polyangiaceae bacterium]|jgi:hypothetical protein